MPAGVPPPAWRSQARAGYAEARWFQDAMTDDLGIWRGNALFDEAHGIPLDSASAQATTWAQLSQRIGTASESLYSAEAGAPDPNSAAVASHTVEALNSVRSSLEARAAARARRAGSFIRHRSHHLYRVPNFPSYLACQKETT